VQQNPALSDKQKGTLGKVRVATAYASMSAQPEMLLHKLVEVKEAKKFSASTAASHIM
jgi:hypothetical protein